MASEKTVEPPRPELSSAKRALIEARLRGQVRSSGIVPRAHRDGAPLSFAQERLWFIDRLEPGSAIYNIRVAWRLGGALDEAALERVLGEIVRRHEALRTTFREVDGEPVQVIAPFGGFTLPVEDLSGLGEADREVEVRRRTTQEAMRSFDLAAGPLFRAALLRLDEESHVLLLSMHHIVSDGWSMGVLFRELSALYAAYREGRESPLPELGVQYADYAAWQREHLRGKVLERHLSYWRERLAGAPELLELPTDHPRPAVQTFRGASERIAFPGELLERLRALGRSEGATLYMVVLSAFQVLLSKYTGSEDVVVGSPIAGRTRDEVAGLIGFFVNTLVLRTDLGGDPTFREVLRRVREVTLGAYEHQELPFEKLVAELQPERSLSHSPLFQVLFTLDDAEETGSGAAESSTEGGEPDFTFAKLDLALSLEVTRRGLLGGLIYSTDLFERGTIERMLGHLERVMEQAAADADVRLSQLGLLGEAERALVLEEWNRTEAEYPADRCIHELFEAQVERTPGAAALAFEDETLSYAELNERANRLAHHLAGLGVGPETRVGICLERGPEMVVSVLAVLKAGGAYVPLDPAYPAERLAFVLADAAVPVLVTQESLRAALPAGDGVAVVSVDGDGAQIAAESAENPERGVSPDNLAYVIHTSGSTGTPKGVMVPHRGVPNLAYAQARRFGIDGTSRVLQFASFSFDAAAAELFDALLAGATLVLASREALLPGPGLLETLRRGGVTVATLPPSVLAILPPDDLPELRTVVSAGEAVDAATVERWSAGRAFVNAYGPTETTVCATSASCEADGRVPAIGRALENVRVYVLDAAGRPVPVGVPGELYVGGVGVARGYLGRAAITAERFVPDPFSAEGGARLYRTGDRARWRAEGAIEYLGRLDFQVKVRGFRIELGEIEAVLRSHESVTDCVVVARAQAGETRLVAYIVGDVEAEALRAHVRRSLPEYMLPSAFVFLDTLPLTPNGKLDRKALPAPEFASAETYVAPRTPVEEVLAGIWAEVLRLERVGVGESFFELGGHSLLATRVVSRVRELFGVELPLRAVFEGPTVAELAGRVEEMRRAGEGAVLPPLAPVVREAPLPLSFAQERLWFLHQMDPQGASYNMPFPRLLRGSLDVGALERALGALTERHEVLRTTFRPVEQGVVQVVHPAAPAHLPVLDLTGLASREREHEAHRLAREDAELPFDLERGPLLRATLLRLSDDEHMLLLTMHHIISDGWSMGVFFRELFVLYETLSQSSGAARPASPLPPLAVQYADFAVWQRGWLQGDVLQRQIDWWRERLGGAPPALELPTDRPRPAVASSRGESLMLRLSADVTRGLRSLARREGATLYMVTHAALDLLLSRWSGQDDLVVGSPIAGRTQVGTEGLIGFFVNTLALRIDLSGDPSFQELVRRVRETALGAYAHQELPFERLVEEVAPERGLSHTPLFQVMFTLQNMDAGEGSGQASGQGSANDGLRLEPLGSEIRTARFDLELDLHEVDDELFGSLRFRSDLFDAATMERFAAQYRAALAAAAASPEERLSRLAILPDEEVRQILAFGGGSARDAAGDAPVHLLFAEQAARTPDAPALLFGGESLTCAELDARAERLARRLRGRAVPGATIAVCLERGPEAVVALLAVWKMGGVYLPLDPSHPVERLSFLLQDSGAKLVVSDLPLAGVLAAREADVLLLDPSAEGDLPGAEDLELRGDRGPADLAYLIYTSGSTGTPKAVMVEHAQLTHTLRASLETLGFAPGDVVAALASTAFDISLLELLTPLLAGGAVRVVPHEVARDPETLVEVVGDVTVLHAVPALMRQVVEVVRGGGTLPSLRLLLVGGDSVPPGLLEDMRELLPAAQTRVLYGPTEATIICATYAVPAEGAVAGHPLGRPLPGVRLAVRGPRGELAPVGVPGEVWISGGGVARGYLGRPELNAEKFVGAGTERAYRTGDRARWRADGVLEFLGRADEQVKVRGFRIEPGEVESVLREQPGVREAVVLAREDAPGDRRLVAYVVPGADGVETAAGREQVSEWETLFDDTYAQDEGEEDPTLALKGWNSSYTGEPIPREEMREWVEHTVERILALRPERVLEVGCGTGLLLFRVAPHTRGYHGTDFSGVALEHVRRHAAGLPQVTLSEREADELAEFAGAGFDLVVVNSVAQYFPDLDYLLRVLEGAAAALRPGGRIFVGDVRSLPLAGAFHASVELARAPDDLAAGQLRARVRRGMAEEQELLLDPALFEAVRARMPRLGRVEVQAKRGDADNEVTRFRYDVVLHLDADLADAANPVVREWSGKDADGLRALAEGSTSALLVRGVPDARVREHVRAYELVLAGGESSDAAAVRALAAGDAGGIAPGTLFALAGELAREIEVRPGASGTLDVLFHPPGDVARFPVAVDAERPWESYANDPQWGRRMRALVPALREAARARLPEYMVPSAFVVLEAFPVTANGKVDRGALPAPDTLGSREAYVAPRTPAEERMAGIWAEVLGVERVGAEDHFFDLGGHSLLATQLVSRVREAFGAELPLRAVFEAPTLAELAGRVEALRRAELPVLPPVVPVERTGPLPLSFAQERLWFIDRLEPGSTTYSLPGAWRLGGALDLAALERALSEIVRRHEALRTTFGEVDGSPVQVIAPVGGFALPVEDFSGLAEADREAALGRRVTEEARRAFDLSAGPLFRAALLRLDAEEHVLLLSMHHIVSDGWSIGVLFRELSALYEAYRQGRESPLPELPVQYADYSVWQREQLAGEVLDRQLAYWKERLAGAPELLELPTDHPRPAVQTYRGASVPVELSPELLERLQALGRSEGTTLYMTLLGAFQVLLSKYAGSEDVVVGSPIAGRTRSEVEGLIGFFVNTLVLRTDLSGDPSFRETLRRVREATLGAYAHQEVPFEKLVAELQPERSLSHSPLFQVMFTLQDAGGGGVALQDAGGGGGALPGLEVSGGGSAVEIAQFDLSMMLAATAQGVRGTLNYSTDLFERGTIERMLGHLARVLEQVAADADVRLSRLELLGEAERALVLEEWNRTEAEYPADRCIHELFEAQAARTPDAVALRFEEESLTYAELNERANRLAHHLRGRGVGPEVRVGVLMERSLEMVVSLLAVIKAGGAYVPLDPGLPAERLAYMLDDSTVPLVLVQAALLGAVPAREGVDVLAVDALAERLASEPAENPSAGAGPDSLAYVIYTSGSTGRPKGVMNQHRGVVNRLVWMQAQFGIGADDVVLQKTPFGFDVSVWELFWPLQQGACLVMARPDGHRDPLYLQEVIERRGVTTLHFVPSMLQQFVETAEAARCGSLLRVVCSGEALPPALVERFHERFPAPVELHNLYGPTEAAVDVSHWPCARTSPVTVVPIGRPVWNTALYVLDAGLRPVPVGTPGELYIGGVQVARGYLDRPGLTAERFVPDPFSAAGGARLYRTGDSARWRADGAVEYLGRLDFQVKVRGFRIELGEIEAALRRSEGVADCVVVAREDVPGETRLVAYVVGEAEAEALRDRLRQSLPEYMLPSAFVSLDALPLTPNGKLDRKALPAPDGDAYARGSYEAPLGEVEAALAEIWSELLGLERVGRWDHFFELGGHSLLAIKLIGRMRQAGLHTDVRALFTTPVLAELALAVGGASSEVEVPANGIPEGCELLTPEMLPLVELSQSEIDRIVAEVPGGAANVQDIYPLAPLQEGLLFHHLLSKEGDPYLTPSVTEFDTRARLERYLAALQAVIDRHDILRTAMAWEGLREPVQVVWRHAPLPVEEVELDAEGEDAAEQLWRRYDPRHYRMDLTRAPLRRACIAEDRARGRWLLLMLSHHLTGDYESLEVEREEVSAHTRGLASELPAPRPFRNYVAQARLGVSQEEHERFFSAMLGDVDEPTAPYGLLDVRGEGHGIGEAWLQVGGDLSARLRRRARALGVSAASLCHLAWAQVLARVSGRSDVVFGTLLFGRMQGGEGTDRVMGPFINTLPVRIGVGEEGVEAAVRRTHVLLADLLRHEHASLALAQRASGVAAPAPLFTSLLNYRHGGGKGRSQQAEQAEQAEQAGQGVRGIGAQERTNYPVTLSVDDLGEAFSLSSQVAAPADAERVCRLMHTALERLVEALEATPARAIGSLDVLPEAERRQVVEEWNRTEAEYPADRCIHELFQAQAARTPRAVAVIFEGAELTYGELNDRANRLAHHLRGYGVGPEVRVGICVERSLEMVVGILAVLKAGGAYVPLDPGQPAERLAYMLSDSAPAVVLTQRELRGRVEKTDVPVLEIDADGPEWAHHLATDPAIEGLTPAHLAYAIYTSGSTGRPKGVLGTHRATVNRLAWGWEAYPYGPGEVVAQKTAIGFVDAVAEIFGPLLAGVPLAIIGDGAAREPERLVDALAAEGCTRIVLVPSLLRAMLDATPELGARLPALRTWVCSGERLDAELCRAFARAVPDGVLVNLYGSSEVAADVTCFDTRGLGEGDGAVPIGRPIANTRIYVLDWALRPVPAGVPGEICAGGDGVARGYLDRPGLTAERFVPDPFAARPGARMYRTGDRARWTAEGVLEYLGRADHQVKLRGIRIEPGEVEAVLAAHPAVRLAVVDVRELVPGEPSLAAWVVAENGAAPASAELEGWLRERLPDYMVPRAIVSLEALPLGPTGKLDRRALPEPSRAAAAWESPRTPVEEALAEIWAEVLRVERVGAGDHFFALGGHSLLAVRVVSRVRRVLGVEVALGDVFERPVLADFARAIENAVRTELPPIEPVERTDRLPLSFAQQRLWFLEQLGGLGSTYHIPMQLRLQGELDRGALRRALDAIVARHEALRTTFVEVEGEPVQRIAPVEESRFHLAEHDLRGDPEAQTELRRLLGEEARAPFDLAQGPLIRGRLIRLADDDYLLHVTMHHIVSDGWSMGVFTGELEALYGAFRCGEPDPLTPLPVQYADYAAWQRRWVDGDVLKAQADYWRATLGGAPELLELPTDHPRPARQDHAGVSLAVVMDQALTAGLKALGQRHGTTLFMTVLAGWAAVLGRLSGQEDVVVGTPTANRGRIEIEGLIGFFVNTLALRVDLAGSPTVAEVLTRVKERSLGAQQNQDIPFEQVVELVQPARSMAHSPLFQVMFTWQNAPRGGPELSGLTLGLPGSAGSVAGSADSAWEAAAKFDLSLDLSERDGLIVGSATYATSLFDRATVERWMGYLRRVLEAMVADERQPVDRLALLTEHERRQVVEEWNRTEAEYPADRCIHELFEAQAARTPDAVAVRFEEESLTYGELNERANRLAHHLRGHGVGPEVRVGICLERSLEMVVSLLAVLKAGGAYVPLDPGYPAERLSFILADSATPVLLTREALRGALPAREGVEVVSLDGAAAEIAAESAENPESGAGPDSLAYVIYTSGSTGAPKGALIEHRNVARLFSATDAWFGFGPSDVWTLFHSYAFDFSVWELWGALLYGGRVVVVPHLVSRDPEAFHALVQREGVTVLNQTPSAFRQFIRVDGERGGDLALRNVIFGGEALEPASLREWVERRGIDTPRLVNMYGITETTVHVTWRPLGREDVFGGSGSPIGRAIPDLRLYVLDRARQPVPIGVPGELYVGGAGVARGYLNRPELTAERFVDNPFAPGRLYRSGDRVRWLADGTLEYLGRLDEQVKVRGFRIELGEIEARLAEHPEVREAVVLAREDVPGDRRLVAYVVGAVEAEALRDRLRQSLPEYMVPGAFVVLDRLPLTVNGKLDRKALPAPEYASAEDQYVAPRTPTEEVLAGIWAEVLRLERVGVEDRFFDLGGHSLLAVRVVSRVRRVLGVEVALGDVFERPVLADFARAIENAARTELPPIERVDRGGRLPLSFAQQRLWFLEQLGDLGGTYHMSMQLPLQGELDRGALRRALDRIVARHEALRTTFVEVEGEPVQRIAPVEESRFHLAEHDLGGDPEAQSELQRLLGEEARAPFDLVQGPLIRGRLIRLAPDEHLLHVTMHHIVSDGWSMELFTRELGALYEAFRRGEPDPLPPLPVQYADYAAWQRRWVDGDVLKAQADYWRATLGGAPELLELPTDHPRPARQDHAGASLGVVMDEALTAGLKALGQRHGTTLFMTVLAGWAAVLGRLSGQEDVVVGTPTANRGRIEIEGLIGFFVNTLAVRVDLAGSPSVAEVLARVKERALGAQQNQDIPFEQVVDLVQPARSMAHSPLFQVMLAWQNVSRSGVELPGLTPGSPGSPGSASQAAAKFDLSLDLSEWDGRIVGSVTYATSLFDRATMERHVGYLRRVLEAMVADERQPVERLALLPEHECRQVVEEWNRTDAEYPADRCIHELFQAQAARTPRAVAVIFEGAELTYGELNDRANRLAHHLRGHGVGPEVRVGICVERSLEMVVGILAVLKAGGAYVPLDPGQPAERLAYMLADSAPAVVLTQRELRDRVEKTDVPVLEIDADGPEWAHHPATDPAIEGLTPAHLAYVIYTSGSTGRPKGVLGTHRATVNRLAWGWETYPYGPGEVVAQKTAIGFVDAVAETFGPLLAGVPLAIIGDGAAREPERLVDALAAEGCTRIVLVPSLLRAMLDAAPELGARLPALRTWVCSGERLDAELCRAFARAVPDGVLVNLYGSSEVAADVTCFDTRALGEDDGAVPIGRPIANTRTYVLDAGLRPVPAGVPGEICAGGAGVARGYLDRPGLTAERFVPDPFAAQPGARMYRTGDRGRFQPDGTLLYLGRLDAQVKLRGIRIEPGEIEAVLRRHPAVVECAVVARTAAAGDTRLVAYVVGAAEAEALRTHARGSLPEYMVPSAFVLLDALPLTPNGKLDRKALPAPEYASAERYVAPRTPTEEVLAGIWAELLRLERVGVTESFFELGGHSLLATRVVSRVRERFNVELPLRAVFEHRTVEELARVLVERGSVALAEPVSEPAAGPEASPHHLLEVLDELSEEELDRLLGAQS